MTGRRCIWREPPLEKRPRWDYYKCGTHPLGECRDCGTETDRWLSCEAGVLPPDTLHTLVAVCQCQRCAWLEAIRYLEAKMKLLPSEEEYLPWLRAQVV